MATKFQVRSDRGTVARIVQPAPTIFRIAGASRGPQGQPGEDGITPPNPNFIGVEGNIEITGDYPDYIFRVLHQMSIINVKDFGATGDGTTDDTAAIQDAINSVELSGGTIYLPKGIYKISDTLELLNGVTLLGDGEESTFINMTNGDVHAIHADDKGSISLENFILTGPATGTGCGIRLEWTANGNTPYITMRNIWVRNFGSDGIQLETPIVSHLDKVLSFDNGGHGFNFSHAGTSTTLTSCWARGNAQAGYYFYQSVYMSLVSCAADNNGVGYFVEDAQSISFHSCGSEGSTMNGVPYNGFGWVIDNSSIINLHGCWITDNRNIGVWVTNGANGVQLNVADNSPSVDAVYFFQTDGGTNSTIYDLHNTTGNNIATDSVLIINDGTGGIVANGEITSQDAMNVVGTSGTLSLTAVPDGAEFNLSANATGYLAIFGSGGNTLGLNLLDGKLVLDAGFKMTSDSPGAGKVLTSDADGDGTWQDPATPAGVVNTANSPNANEFARFTDADTIEGRTAAELKADLDLEVGVDLQAYDADLATIAGLTATTDNFIVSVSSAWASRTPSQVRTTLGLVIGTNVQAYDADLATIAGLTATTDNFLQAKSSAWASRTPTQVTADLIVMVGDSGSGGSKGLVPAPTTGDSTKFLRGDATWQTIPGGGDALTSGNLSQFAATTSAQLRGVLSDETGTGAAVFASAPTLTAPVVNGTSGNLTISAATDGGEFNISSDAAGDLAIFKSGAGALNLDLLDGDLKTADTVRLTNAGLLQNITSINGVTIPTGNIVGISDTQTLTNKRVTPRTGTTTSSGTPTINTDNVDVYTITAQAAAITSMTTNLSGTPTTGQRLLIRIKDNGTARAITWGASFQSSGVATLPTTTVISKTHMILFIWDEVVSKWVCAAVDATGY